VANLEPIAILPVIIAPTAPVSESGWSILLPLIGAIIGAIIGAFANGLYRDWQEKEAQDRERKGLLRLIDAEIFFNTSFYRQFKVNSPFIGAQSVDALRTEYWDSANARLAQLLPDNHMKVLTTYYFFVYLTKSTIKDERSDDSAGIVVGQLDTIMNAGRTAREYGQRYLKDPDYTEDDPAAQNQSSGTGPRISFNLQIAVSRENLLAGLRDPKPEDTFLRAEAQHYLRGNPDDTELRQALDRLPERD
jgi:hypothetical protein